MLTLVKRRQEESREFHAAERERLRRFTLHRRIGALEAKLDELGGCPLDRGRARWWRLFNHIRALKAALDQPELML